VVNHLKSKGSGCGAGDDDTTTGQGNCNDTRTKAAQELAAWLAADPTNSNEDPIVALENAGYTDLIDQFNGGAAYSFLFDGQLGYLDHALANASLLPQVTGITEWHINADEVNLLDYNDMELDAGERDFEEKPEPNPLYEPNPSRSSDHDPLIVGLDLQPPPSPTLDCSVSPDQLWPPNHKLVTVHAMITIVDPGVGDAAFTLLSVSSNEPDSGLGGGDKPDDIQDFVIGTPDTSGQLRAERAGNGAGRIYTFTYEATNSAGQSATCNVTVTVPHDQGKGGRLGANEAATDSIQDRTSGANGAQSQKVFLPLVNQ